MNVLVLYGYVVALRSRYDKKTELGSLTGNGRGGAFNSEEAMLSVHKRFCNCHLATESLSRKAPAAVQQIGLLAITLVCPYPGTRLVRDSICQVDTARDVPQPF